MTNNHCQFLGELVQDDIPVRRFKAESGYYHNIPDISIFYVKLRYCLGELRISPLYIFGGGGALSTIFENKTVNALE